MVYIKTILNVRWAHIRGKDAVMKKDNRVICESELEFVQEVADDCVKNLREKDRAYLMENPYALDYHFTYCLYIRNHYIHNRDFSEAPFWAEPDHLSSKIIRMIFSRLLPEYDYDNSFITSLYDTKKFIKLRKEYKGIYGEYPISLVEKYKEQVSLEPVKSISEIRFGTEEEVKQAIETMEKNHESIAKVIDSLLSELAELVWRTDALKETAEENGIGYDLISEKVEELKHIFFAEGEYIPLQVCFLPYREKIGQEKYVAYRKLLTEQLKEHPGLVEKLDQAYFSDRVLARSVLKQHGWALRYLPMYQNDEKMVRLSLGNNGEAIQYADKRFWKDREWVKFAIGHSGAGTIMYLDCMKPYRKDRELVYLACSVERWNFAYVDKSFRDDFDLAKLCMEQIGKSRGIYDYMSKRLKDNKELALIDLEEHFPSVGYYSKRLRNDDEIAAKLYELHGADSWAWYHMSKRLREKYGIADDE